MEQLSYVHTPLSYRYHYQTIPERLQFQSEVLGDKEIYVFIEPDGKRTSITARELFEKSKRLATSFVNLGLRKGEIIALCLHNNIYGLISLFGVILSGAVVLNLISAKEDGSDLINRLSKVGATALIVDSGKNSPGFKKCLTFIEEYDAEGNANSSKVPTLRYLLTSTKVDTQAKTLTLEELFSSSLVDNDLPKLDASNICTLFPTSGSTGDSKFVPMSHFQMMIIGHQLHESIQYNPDDVIYTERRFAWIGGFPFMLLHNGVKVVTKTTAISSLERHCRFTWEVLLTENCTHACLLPVTIIGLNDLVSESTENSLLLKGIQTGALPVAATCYSGIGKLASRITNCYGSSEAGFVTSLHVTTRETEYELDYNTGPPLQGVEVKIVDEKGFLVKREEQGNIYVRSPSLLSEYYQNRQKTDEVLSSSRWFNTDDVGLINKQGHLIVTGRQSDIILQGGKAHVPSVVEALIKSHPGVLDAIVVPVPDDILFQLVCACIIPKPGSNLQSKDFREFYASKFLADANEAFSGFLPRMFLIFDEYPRLYTGKPDKRGLIQIATQRKSETISGGE